MIRSKAFSKPILALFIFISSCSTTGLVHDTEGIAIYDNFKKCSSTEKNVLNNSCLDQFKGHHQFKAKLESVEANPYLKSFYHAKFYLSQVEYNVLGFAGETRIIRCTFDEKSAFYKDISTVAVGTVVELKAKIKDMFYTKEMIKSIGTYFTSESMRLEDCTLIK